MQDGCIPMGAFSDLSLHVGTFLTEVCMHVGPCVAGQLRAVNVQLLATLDRDEGALWHMLLLKSFPDTTLPAEVPAIGWFAALGSEVTFHTKPSFYCILRRETDGWLRRMAERAARITLRDGTPSLACSTLANRLEEKARRLLSVQRPLGGAAACRNQAKSGECRNIIMLEHSGAALQCNLCHKSLPHDMVRYSCRSCNYAHCQACYDGRLQHRHIISVRPINEAWPCRTNHCMRTPYEERPVFDIGFHHNPSWSDNLSAVALSVPEAQLVQPLRFQRKRGRTAPWIDVTQNEFDKPIDWLALSSDLLLNIGLNFEDSERHTLCQTPGGWTWGRPVYTPEFLTSLDCVGGAFVGFAKADLGDVSGAEYDFALNTAAANAFPGAHACTWAENCVYGAVTGLTGILNYSGRPAVFAGGGKHVDDSNVVSLRAIHRGKIFKPAQSNAKEKNGFVRPKRLGGGLLVTVVCVGPEEWPPPPA